MRKYINMIYTKLLKKRPILHSIGLFFVLELNYFSMRIRASTATTSDWWTREFNIFEGKIEYRGTGNDQAAVPVTAGQIVTLNFADNTGSIQ